MLSQDFSAGLCSTSTTPYNINPLQHLPWSLVGPLIVITQKENPDTVQERERVCEGFINPGPDSCSCTWERTPVDKEHQPLSVRYSHHHPIDSGLTSETLTQGTVTRHRRRLSSLIFYSKSLPSPETSSPCEERAVRPHSPGEDLPWSWERSLHVGQPFL